MNDSIYYDGESVCCRRHFYIVSEMHQKVLDIEGGSSSPGARVIVWPKKVSGDRQNQLWYFDENGIIRSALNDFALTAEGEQCCRFISIIMVLALASIFMFHLRILWLPKCG